MVIGAKQTFWSDAFYDAFYKELREQFGAIDRIHWSRPVDTMQRAMRASELFRGYTITD